VTGSADHVLDTLLGVGEERQVAAEPSETLLQEVPHERLAR